MKAFQRQKSKSQEPPMVHRGLQELKPSFWVYPFPYATLVAFPDPPLIHGRRPLELRALRPLLTGVLKIFKC